MNDRNSALCFEDLQVGDVWVTPARTVTETDVVQFAAMTGDFNPLHIDHQFAENGPFGKPVAHGLLGISWVAGLGCNNPRVNTAAFVGIRDWSFLRPVYIGDTLHAESSIADKGAVNKRGGTVIWEHRLINQRGKIVQRGIFETLVALRAE